MKIVYKIYSYSISIKNLSSLLKEVEDKNEEVIIERAGKPIAKIIKYNPMKSIILIDLGYLKNSV